MRDLTVWALSLRLGVAALAGLTLGFERELRARAAGLRTHALVAVGAALFTIAGAYGFADIPRGPNVDPARIAAQVASGIGFLGAGAILRQGYGVRGLTTAATLWLAAAIGGAAGAGAHPAGGIGAGGGVGGPRALRGGGPLGGRRLRRGRYRHGRGARGARRHAGGRSVAATAQLVDERLGDPLRARARHARTGVEIDRGGERPDRVVGSHR